MQLAVRWLALPALAVPSCQRIWAPSGPMSSAAKGEGVPAAEPLERGDAKTAELSQSALAAGSENLALARGLVVSVSCLGQRALAMREPTWVEVKPDQDGALGPDPRSIAPGPGTIPRPDPMAWVRAPRPRYILLTNFVSVFRVGGAAGAAA